MNILLFLLLFGASTGFHVARINQDFEDEIENMEIQES